MIPDIKNPSFYFYKDSAYGKDIESFELKHNYKELFTIQNAQTFDLITIYPGLLVGSGYNHPKLKDNTDDFQLGFFFDHITGLPIISGSSIKGMLRSVFKQTEFMQEVYDKALDESVFEDNETIFYDAFIVSTKDDKNKIFGSDYITSHFSNEIDGEFKSPNPIKFLKVLPEVTFRFQFSCSTEYRELFKSILLDFGVGAKTNVGYGQFEEHLTAEQIKEREQEQKEREAKKKAEEEEQKRLKKEKEEEERLKEQKRQQNAKKAKAQEGLSQLLECKTLAEGFKLLKDSLGKKPKPTVEEKEIIKSFRSMQKKLSKGEIKTFEKYGV